MDLDKPHTIACMDESEMGETLPTGEEHYRSLFDNMLNGFAYCRMLFEEGHPADFIYLSVNRAFKSMTGLGHVVGKKVTEIIPGIRESDPELFESYGRVALTGIPESFETFIKTLGMWFSISVYSPKKEYFVAVFDVITERKKTEEALREREQQLIRERALLRELVDSIPDLIFFKNEDSVYLGCNKGFEVYSGMPEKELIGKTDLDFAPRDAAKFYQKKDHEMLSSGAAQRNEEWIPFKDGGGGHFDTIKTPYYGPDGELLGLIGISRNITERKVAEEKLKHSEQRFSTIFHASPASTAVTRIRDSKLIDVNKAWLDVTGLTREEAIGHTALELNLWVNPGDRDRLISLLREQNTVRDFELQLRHRSGNISDMLMSAELIELSGEQCVLSLAQDITELKRAEQELRASEEIYSAIVEQAGEGIVLIDSETLGLIEFNDAACHGLGYSRDEFARLTLFDLQETLTREQAVDRVHSVLKTGQMHFENQQRRKDGTYRDVLINNRVINLHGHDYLVGIWQDITERKRSEADKARAEAQLRQAQKMEALGTLAGGIAHDFNNILGIIIGHTQLACLDAEHPDAENTRSTLQEVITASNRAKDLVKQILAFCRRTEQEKQPVMVGVLVKEALKMLRASLPASIEIKHNVTSQALVLADPTQIHQVVMNLCTNAAHAMRDHGGMLEVNLTEEYIAPASIVPHSDLRPGNHVKLTIRDTGHGIDQAIMDRIFDPFFTTKEQGIGTGLGLSVVHGIVKSHHGSVRVQSVQHKGTTFNVFFPVMEKSRAPEAEETAPLSHGKERVLVVDDEPALAMVITRILTRLGYEAEYRTSGQEALQVFRDRLEERAFDLVITDMTMPHITGVDFARQLLDIKPDTPIILCTGFSEQIDTGKAKDIGIRGFLMKPVDIKEISEMIRRVFRE